MNRYPLFKQEKRTSKVFDYFGGYNHNSKIRDHEFYFTENITSDDLPVISTRKRRGLVAKGQGHNFQGLANKDGLCYVDGTDLVINGNHIDLGLSTDAKDCPKSLISMGAYLIIMPDEIYINTVDTTEHGPIDALFRAPGPVTLTPCLSNGKELTAAAIGPSAPENPKDKDLWVDNSDTTHVWKEYSFLSAVWVSLPLTYIKVSAPGIGRAFNEGDGVSIAWGGVELPAAPMPYSDTKSEEQARAIQGNALIKSKTDDWIVIVGMLDEKITMPNSLTVSREMPLMDYVIESGNRLWGCRYGPNRNGNVVNEIYCSKLGDFKNWGVFAGLSTDSYIASCGTDGQFTGAITHGGYPIFFKEEHMHKVFGTEPRNFQIQSIPCRGVEKGCSRSLAIVNEVLYYKSHEGICAYDGSVPGLVSDPLGDVIYTGAVAAGYGNKYYCSMQKKDGWDFLVLDTRKRVWMREDDLHAYLLCDCRDDIYCIDNQGNMLALTGTNGEKENSVFWIAETGMLGSRDLKHSYIRKIRVRLNADVGSSITLSIQYDSSGVWEAIGSYTAQKAKSVSFPFVTRRCDHLRLRLSGYGPATVYGIAEEFGGGSPNDY